MKHLGSQGVSACGASYLLAHDTTQDALQCDCVECLFVVQGNMFQQLDVLANRIRDVVRDDARRPKVVNINPNDRS